MFGMPERITSDDIKTLDDYFKGVNGGKDVQRLIAKIDLLVKQDEISRKAGEEITSLQDEIVKLYKKEGEKDVQEETK